MVIAFSLVTAVVGTIGVTPNDIVDGVVVTGAIKLVEFSFVVVAVDTFGVTPNDRVGGGVIVMLDELSIVVVVAIVGAIGDTPNEIIGEVVVTGVVVLAELSLVVVGIVDGIGDTPNDIVDGVVVLIELSLVVVGDDVFVCTPNNGKLILVVTAGGIDTTLSLVVVGIVCIVIGTGALGSLAIILGDLFANSSSFPVVTDDSIAR